MIRRPLLISEIAGLDQAKIDSHINDLALLTMTNATDWHYRIDRDELVCTHGRRGATFRFSVFEFLADIEPAHPPSREADVRITKEGSLFLFHPLTLAAEEWFAANVNAGDRFGKAVVVEDRYARDLWQVMQDAGLEIARC